jgi:hypothetical protein
MRLIALAAATVAGISLLPGPAGRLLGAVLREVVRALG